MTTPPDTTPEPASPAASRKSLLRVLAGHVVFTFLHTTLFANVLWLMPMLVRLRFGADDPTWRDWQTTLVTAAIPTFMTASIFWAELLRRVSVRRYLLIFWVVFAVPIGCIGFVTTYWQFLACHLVAAVGFAAWAPVNGQLLKHFYSDAVRGRAYGVLNVAQQLGSIGAVYLVGIWMEESPDAFRIFFPAAAVGQLLAIGLLMLLVHRTRAEHELDAEAPRSWAALFRPVLNMGEVLRRDRTFLRYEAAFMTYGAAFMICEALLPVLATDRLDMRYADYAHTTQMIRHVVRLALLLPMGVLLDRIGPVRTSGIAFGVLTLYPLLLLIAETEEMVGVASGVWGVAMAGVMMGWMLGPVSLASSAADVPRYAAIHATLVGVRGVLFQGLGMAAYRMTGSFALPLAVAAAMFVAAAVQMWMLQASIRQRTAADK